MPQDGPTEPAGEFFEGEAVSLPLENHISEPLARLFLSTVEVLSTSSFRALVGLTRAIEELDGGVLAAVLQLDESQFDDASAICLLSTAQLRPRSYADYD